MVLRTIPYPVCRYPEPANPFFRRKGGDLTNFLGSYRLTIKERNGGVRIRGKNRVVDESTSCIVNMNCEGFYDGETELL